MKKLVALAVLVLASGLVVASTAVAGDTPCVGVLTGTFDNVVVPPGATCTLSGSAVRGNVKALENSKLLIQSSNVRGNVEGDKADMVQVQNSMVRGNIQIKEGGPALAPVPAGSTFCFDGVNTTPCEALVSNTTVEEGNVQIEKMVGDVAPFNSRVLKGNVKVEDNNGGLVFVTNNNPVAQNLQVFKNHGPGNKFVTNNTVGDTIQCFENDLPFVGGLNTAPKKEGQCF